MPYYDFKITTASTFTIRAKTKREAESKAAEVFGGGEPVEAIVTGLGAPVVVETFRDLPHGSADAAEPELLEVRRAT